MFLICEGVFMKLLALNGLLGYGYSADALKAAFCQAPDFVGVDGGSTDPGPYYLGSGTSFTDRNAVKRDISLALPLALRAHAPFIVGTSGGSGSRAHVDWLRQIVLEIAEEQRLSFRLAVIYTDVTAEYVLNKQRHGRLTPMGRGLDPDESAIRSCTHIVSQIGAEPIVRALQNGADVVLAGRACDTAIYAAPCLMRGYDPGLAFHMAKIMECGAMCATPVAAADGMQAFMGPTYFQLVPASEHRKCTISGVAAHTMYEQANPYLIYEPDGVIDLRQSQYQQIDPRTVRVSGSRFMPAKTKTLKLEGAALAGFRSISIAGVADPATIAHIDEILQAVRRFVSGNVPDISEDDYIIQLRRYGGQPDLCVVLDVVGKTQSIADTVLALARARMLHCDYAGRKSTAGNLAFPYSPSDIHMGAVYQFCIYHLAQVDDFCETANTVWQQVGGDA